MSLRNIEKSNLVKGINKKLSKVDELPTNTQDLIEKYTCNSSSSDCMDSACDECRLTIVGVEDFVDNLYGAETSVI